MGDQLELDDQFLVDAGYEHLTADQARIALEAIYQALELRVGTVLARTMTDAQLRTFEQLIDSDDEVGALSWLATNRSDYREVVRTEMDTILRRVRAARAVRADEIRALATEVDKSNG